MNKIILLSILSFGLQTQAVKESKVSSTFGPMINTKFRTMSDGCLKPVNKKADYKLCEFKSSFGVKGSINIGYTKFGTRTGRLGSLVIAPGRTESSLKYIEVAHDFLKRGYSPVYAIDHRSQGFSDRTQVETHKVHTTAFRHYVRDFNKFVEAVVKQDRDVDLDRLFVISNSMGGAITARYLEKYQNHPFKATAMFGAMHKIVYPKPFNETLAALAGTVLCFPLIKKIRIAGLKCQEFAPGRGERFDSSKRVFKGNKLTSSKARFNFRDALWRRFPQIQTGGVTVQWAGTAALAGKILRINASRIRIPMQVYTAEHDVIVERSGHIKVCKRALDCEHIDVKGSQHEILMEKDSIRLPAMKRMWDFFELL